MTDAARAKDGASAASVREVIDFLRQRASNLNEMACEWEHIEYHRAEDYWNRAHLFEEVAEMVAQEFTR